LTFHQKNQLKLTSLSKKVLFDKEQVSLAHLKEFEKTKEIQIKNVAKTKTAPDLFETLRVLRLQLAREADIPAYQIFNDATLKEIVKFRPMTDEEFMQISGVGRKKLQDYGHIFIKAIVDFSAQKRKKKKKPKSGNTQKETLALLQTGLSIEEISEKREISTSTVVTHLLKLYDEGENITLKNLINHSDIESIREAKKELDNPNALRPYFDFFEEAIDYNTIKIALKVIENE